MSLAPVFFLGMDLPTAVAGHLGLIIGSLIVVVGLFLIGFKDLIRFQPRRIWAISGVCFDESIRRRILWITPLAILGVIVVAQLQKPSDEQDAIRQTTKFCLFATGLVVTISAVILACTNLPREIENRVIFTVVTKPTTRLEIVLGKILGFGRVCAAILLIMGLFTYGYLWLRAHNMEAGIRERLDQSAVDPITNPTLEHYVKAGLLNAQAMANSPAMGIYSQVPPVKDGRRFFNEGYVLIPFVLPGDVSIPTDTTGKVSTEAGMIIRLHIGFDRWVQSALMPSEAAKLHGTTQPLVPPQILVQIFDEGQNSLLTQEVDGGKAISLPNPDGNDIQLPVPAASMVTLLKHPFFYVALVPGSTNAEFWIDPNPVSVVVPTGTKPDVKTIQPSNPTDPNQPAQFVFAGRQGLDGQQIAGAADANKAQVAVYPFTNLPVSASADGTVPIQLRVSIENGADEGDAESPTLVKLQARNRQTGVVTDLTDMQPENNRPVYGSMPAAAVSGGDFDIIIRCLTPQHWVGLKPDSLAIVQSESTFAMNLLKSLTIIWLLATLVVAISIFCSTFLSWPIAIVLTLLILLGHWGVEQLGDAASAGLGRQFVTDFGVRDPAQAQAISATVENLNKVLTTVSTVLPDINHFSATEDIERGITIPAAKIWDALLAALAFGVPLTVLAYVFLKNKEVAP